MKKSISIMLVFAMIATIFSMCGITSFAEDDILSYLTYEINDGEVTITACDESISGDVVIPDTIEGYPVTAIAGFVFSGCEKLTNITIPDSVTTIALITTFRGCNNLENVVLPENIFVYEGVGARTFMHCFNLKKITLPDSLTSVEVAMFFGCLSLEQISLSENVNSIGTKAFFGCLSMKDFYIYNPDITIEDKSIGYTAQKLTVDVDTFLNDYWMTENEDDVIINYDEPVKNEDLTIHGYKGSTAEAYALEHGFEFVPICDHENTAVINTVTADCANDGYTGDVYCNDCEEIIEYGEVITATGHADADNNYICDVCETELEVQNPEPEVPETPEEPDYTEEEPQSFFDKIIAFFNRIFEMIKNLFGLA